MYTYLDITEFYIEFLAVFLTGHFHFSSRIEARPKPMNSPTIWEIGGAIFNTKVNARRIYTTPQCKLIKIKMYLAV